MLFKDQKYQAELEKNGFVVLPFLSSEQVAELNECYDDAHNEDDPPDIVDNIHMTTWCRDPDYKKAVAQKLDKLFAGPSAKYFKNYRRLNNVFIVKKSDSGSTFKVHQDWSVIDETVYQSVNVWVPLHDVDETAGALWLLKGSHKLDRKIRGAGYLWIDYGPHYAELKKNATSVSLKAGQAVVFYHSVIHGSPPNLAGTNRKAACFTVIPERAPLSIYFQPDARSPLEQHEPEDDFVYKYDYLRAQSHIAGPTQQPKNILPPYVNKKIEAAELKKVFNLYRKFWRFWEK